MKGEEEEMMQVASPVRTDNGALPNELLSFACGRLQLQDSLMSRAWTLTQAVKSVGQLTSGGGFLAQHLNNMSTLKDKDVCGNFDSYYGQGLLPQPTEFPFSVL